MRKPGPRCEPQIPPSQGEEAKKAQMEVNEEQVSLWAAAGVKGRFQGWSQSCSVKTEAGKCTRPQIYVLLIKTT